MNWLNKIFKKFLNPKLMWQSKIVPNVLPKLKQKVLFTGKGKISFGENVQIGYFPSPYFYSTYAHIEARNKTSEIKIGSNTYINNNCSIISNGCKIEIGENCRIGANFQCYDSDFHSVNAETRDTPEFIKNNDVKIGDNVFIGNNVIVLKGVTIGNGATIGVGAVVTKNVAPNTIVAGVPARMLSFNHECSEKTVTPQNP